MASRKIPTREPIGEATLADHSHLSLAPKTTHIRKNGIEFLSSKPLEPWTEVTVALHHPADAKEWHASGVVVDCRGDRHRGYTVSLVFADLTPHAQARLDLMAYSNLA